MVMAAMMTLAMTVGGRSVDKLHAGDIIWIMLPFNQPKVGPGGDRNGRDWNHEEGHDSDTTG